MTRQTQWCWWAPLFRVHTGICWLFAINISICCIWDVEGCTCCPLSLTRSPTYEPVPDVSLNLGMLYQQLEVLCLLEQSNNSYHGIHIKYCFYSVVRLFCSFFLIINQCWLSSMFDWRQCATNQYLRRKADPHRYCRGACADRTKCGPVIVPEKHLQVRWATQGLLHLWNVSVCGNQWKSYCH